MQFYDKLDTTSSLVVPFSLLEAGLDTISSRLPGYFTVVVAMRHHFASLEDGQVTREQWRVACLEVLQARDKVPGPVSGTAIADAAVAALSPEARGEAARTLSALLPDLRRAVDTLDQGQVQRRVEQRRIFGHSLASPDLSLSGSRWPPAGGSEAADGSGAGAVDSQGASGEGPRAPWTRERLEAEHRRLLVRFFKNLDVNDDSWVPHGDLEAGLDALFSRAPSYFELTSVLLQAIGVDSDAAVHEDEWIRACDEAVEEFVAEMPGDGSAMSDMIQELERAIDALDHRRVRRKAKRRMILGRSLDVPVLGEAEFPKQRIEGVSSQKLQRAGLRRFESCLEGYSFIDATLGAGAFARVFLVKNDKTGDIQAMKRIDRQAMERACGLSKEDVLTRIEHEYRHLQHSDHPHIIKLFEFRQDSRYSYFVMEAANGGDLMRVVDNAYGRVRSKPPLGGEGAGPSPEPSRKLSETFVALVLEQTVYALHEFHKEGRIHKDVKLENLMLRTPELPPHVVLIDLGFMEMLPDEQGGERLMPAGTPHTMAPEVIESYLGLRPGFDDRCDIYSLGVVVFELLLGRPPYEPVYAGDGRRADVDYKATLEVIRGLDVGTPLREAGRSADAVDLVSWMCKSDPEDRPTALECLRHSWLVKQGERRAARTRSSIDEPEQDAASQARRQAITEKVQTFARRSALQRGAAYHLAAQMPVSRLRCAAEHLDLVKASIGGMIEREELARALQTCLKVDEACARYVAARVDSEDAIPEDFTTFAADCAELCARREAALLERVAAALDAAKGPGLTVEEVLGVLERLRGGKLELSDLEEWLRPALDDADHGQGQGQRLTRSLLDKHLRTTSPASG